MRSKKGKWKLKRGGGSNKEAEGTEEEVKVNKIKEPFFWCGETVLV